MLHEIVAKKQILNLYNFVSMRIYNFLASIDILEERHRQPGQIEREHKLRSVRIWFNFSTDTAIC